MNQYKHLTDRELKKISADAFLRRYGVAPIYKQITLLEASSNGKYVLFHVNGIRYRVECSGIERLGE